MGTVLLRGFPLPFLHPVFELTEIAFSIPVTFPRSALLNTVKYGIFLSLIRSIIFSSSCVRQTLPSTIKMKRAQFQIKFSIQTGLWIPKSWELLTQWLHCIWTCLWGPPGDVAPAVSQDDSFRSKVLWSHDTENVLFAPGASRVQWLRSMNPVTRQNWI